MCVKLRHPIPPLPVEKRCDVYLMTVSGSRRFSKTVELYAHLIKPLLPPHLRHVLGDIEYGVKSSEISKCDVITPGALTPGILIQGRVVYVNHLHVSFAHTHAKVLKQTSKQHGVRLTR